MIMRRHFIGTTLTVYALSVIAVTIFPIHPHPASYWAGDPFSDMLRWIPGDVDGPSFTLNVIMFIPFGILLPLLWRGSDGYLPMLLRSGLASATIELAQLVLGLTVGSRRTVDINDLIANTAGALIGLLILHLAIPDPDHRARATSSGRP
ncbi:hypothetical protein Ahu01nite_059070 [Winogradskya humida]|uniref:VanZ-like domain-containing protein n=2 Tax=Winogradskya humida TaxID=113566 RepID=A0ABQ3ZW29_9ACTN|nr:hypothetical protein Ahu01nite_059070 [Actinoplanes humidus]